jgi:osmotically inducible lipoprotein OsmB
MKRTRILVPVVFLCCAGCSGLSATEQRVLSGGAIGAGGGALIGAVAGSAALGAAAGGGAGLLGGLVYDQYQKSREAPKTSQAAMVKKPNPALRAKPRPTRKPPETVTAPETSSSSPPPQVM